MKKAFLTGIIYLLEVIETLEHHLRPLKAHNNDTRKMLLTH